MRKYISWDGIVPCFLLNVHYFLSFCWHRFSHRFLDAFFDQKYVKNESNRCCRAPLFSTFFEVAIFYAIFVAFGVTFDRPLAPFGLILAPFWLILGPFWSHLGPDLGYFAPSGVSFWLVLGEIQFLRQKFVKKHSCIDPGIKFLANFRMQTIFPRPGGGTIAAGNRDRCLRKGSKKDACAYYPPDHFGSHFPSKNDEKINAKIDA